MKPGETGIRRLINASRYSASGLRFAWKNEAAFRQEVIMVAVMAPLAFWVGQTALEQAVLLFSLGLVLVVELLNTAIEAVVDRIGPERHILAGSAKDTGSAAVLISIIIMIVVWALMLWQRL